MHEHILVVERAMGKYLRRGAEVHHVDGDGTNNANDNLVVCQDDAYHKLLHARQRALEACGDANASPCRVCSGFDRQCEMVFMCRNKPQYGKGHADCIAEKRRAENQRKFPQGRVEKTHCKFGHALVQTRDQKICLECSRAAKRRHAHRKYHSVPRPWD